MNLEAAAIFPFNQTNACVNSLEVILENLFQKLFCINVKIFKMLQGNLMYKMLEEVCIAYLVE